MSWVFLAGLRMAVNLFHYCFASISEDSDGKVITLYTANPKADNITVKDPRDVSTLIKVFDQASLHPRPLPLALPEQVEDVPDNPPPPAEAATDVGSESEQPAGETATTSLAADGVATLQAGFTASDLVLAPPPPAEEQKPDEQTVSSAPVAADETAETAPEPATEPKSEQSADTAPKPKPAAPPFLKR